MKKAILTCLLVFCLVLQGCAYNAGEKDNAIDENAEKATKSTTTTGKKRETVPVNGECENGDFLFSYSFNKNAYRPGETIKAVVTVKNISGTDLGYYGSTDPDIEAFLFLETPSTYTRLCEKDRVFSDDASMDHVMEKDEAAVYSFWIKVPEDVQEGYYDLSARMIDFPNFKVVFEDVVEIYK